MCSARSLSTSDREATYLSNQLWFIPTSCVKCEPTANVCHHGGARLAAGKLARSPPPSSFVLLTTMPKTTSQHNQHAYIRVESTEAALFLQRHC
jgi:hypothetical protein